MVFGLKIHLFVNDRCELIAFKITQGNQHDNSAAQKLLKGLEGLAFGDKGYLGKKIFEALYKEGLKLITRKRKNMKNQTPLTEYEQNLLNQRGMIEKIFNCLNHKHHIWHTRHRSIFNAISHLVAALAAYVIEPLKMTAIKQLEVKPRELAHIS